jgi:hypothetical protein
METRTFLKTVLGNEGFYCVFAFRTAGTRRIQKFYDSIDAVVDAANNFDAEGFDAYFALATFDEAGSRKVDNVKQLRAFFLDLDCGPGKDYPSQLDAIRDLRRFCSELSLPKPLMVNSGRGVHAYWRLTEPVSGVDWAHVAEQLKRQCAAHKLLADPAVTADAARVLRVPNTHNYKSDPPAPTSMFGKEAPEPVDFDTFAALVGANMIPVPKKHIAAAGSNALLDMLMGNKESRFKEIVKRTQSGTGCGQIQALLTEKANVSEPMWRAGLSIAKFCSDATKAAHVLSVGHPDYSYDATEEKMSHVKGPYLCNTFNEYNPGICTNCAHWGKLKSPITLGQRIKEATEEDNVVEVVNPEQPEAAPEVYNIPKYPFPYFRGVNGGVYVRTTNADGDIEEKLIYHNDLYVVKRVVDVEVGEGLVMRLHLPKDAVREFTLSLSAATSREEFRKLMSSKGVAIMKWDELMQYTMTWINELQSTTDAEQARRQFGWTDDTCTSFVLGNRHIYANHVGENPPSTQTVALFPAFEPKGSFEEWRRVADFYNRPGFELHQYVFGTGFGSVLMQFMPVHCAGLHLYSRESGVGKTTAMAVGASIWGNPEELIIGERDTHNTKMNRGELYHNLPLYMDELTNAKPKELSDLAYQLTGGKQRGRMASGSNTERHRGDAWNLLAVTTGNTSLIERISMDKAMPKAEAQRILEVRVDRIKFASKHETDEFSVAVMENYGWAGEPFVQYVINNVESVKAILFDTQRRLDKAANLEQENRFWSAGGACTLTGLILAKKLGLVHFDMKALFAWFVQVLKENINSVSDMGTSAEQTLVDFFNEHWSEVLWIKSTDDLRGKASGSLDSLIVPEALPRGRLVARYETDLKRAYIVPKMLRQWCSAQQINYTSLLNELTESMQAKKAKMRLSKGTQMQLPPSDVIIVNCNLMTGDDDEAGSSEDTRPQP